MRNLPSGFSVEKFAADWCNPDQDSAGELGRFVEFGGALLEAISEARKASGTKPWRGKPLEPRPYAAVSGAAWKSAGQLGGLNLPMLIASAQHYLDPGNALKLGLSPAGVALGKFDLEFFELALAFYDECQKIHRMRELAAGTAGLIT